MRLDCSVNGTFTLLDCINPCCQLGTKIVSAGDQRLMDIIEKALPKQPIEKSHTHKTWIPIELTPQLQTDIPPNLGGNLRANEVGRWLCSLRAMRTCTRP